MATATSNGRVSSTVTQPTTSIAVYDSRRATMRPRTGDITQEIGTTGLRQYGGFVLEEWLTQLQGKRGAWVYREMMDNSAIIGGILYAIEMLSRKAEYQVEGSKEKMPRGNMLATEFIETCMHDMSHTWGDFMSEALSFLPYGWSLHEEVFKRRLGSDFPPPPMDERETAVSETEEAEEPPNSKYDDGLIGWRKLPVRAQETLLRWGFRGYSQVRYMEQIDWHGGDHKIPIEKAMLFRTKALRGNPEGRSILRNAYQAYFYIQNIQNIEAIGIERDLAGLPKATPPEGVDIFHESNKGLLERVQQMVASVRRDENEGLVMPAGWEFELVSTGGARQMNTDDILRRYRQEMAASMLADFFLVGLDGLGSYAMVDIKSDLFGLAMDATLDIFCEVMNRHSIPRLLKLNGATIKEPPRISHSSAGRIDLERVGQFLYQLSSAGAQIPWTKGMIARLLMGAGLPAAFEGEALQTEDVEGNAASEKGQGKPTESGEPQKSPGSKKPAREPAKKGEAINVTDALRKRHTALSTQLEQEVKGALRHLGELAATSYMTHAEKGDQKSRNVANRVMRSLQLPSWADGHLGLILRNHTARVQADTHRLLQQEVGPEMRLDVDKGATTPPPNLLKSDEFNARDIEPQVRAAITKAIEDGRSRGESVIKVARRIRDYVPAGRFTKAGSKYRSQLIARNETARIQRDSILKAYESHPDVTAVRLRDGVYGPPRSDTQCMERDGQIVPIGEAASVLPYHPLCTLSFDPIVT